MKKRNRAVLERKIKAVVMDRRTGWKTTHEASYADWTEGKYACDCYRGLYPQTISRCRGYYRYYVIEREDGGDPNEFNKFYDLSKLPKPKPAVIMYQAIFNNGAVIDEVTVTDETPTCYIIGKQLVLKESDKHCFFRTFKEAKLFLLYKKIKELKEALEVINFAVEDIEYLWNLEIIRKKRLSIS
jgi:hypothetical protein